MTNLKDIRNSIGMTQQTFGDYFGIPKRTVQNWECDVNKIPDYLLNLMIYKLEKEGLI